MPAGSLQPRVKTWVSTEDVVFSDLNAEFDNLLAAMQPLLIDDYSTNVAQMQVQTDPGEVGTESLATTLAGELARIRFEIKEMKGTTYHYTSANSSINELASALGGGLPLNRISSGRMKSTSDMPQYLVPHGTNRTVSLKGATTNFVYYIDGVSYTISTDVTSSTLVAAPTSNNTVLVNDATLSGQEFTKLLGEYETVIPIDNVGSEITSLNGKLAAFKVGSTEYFLARVDTTNSCLRDVRRGWYFDSADASKERVALSDNNTITLMKLAWIFAKANGTIAVTYTNPRWSKDEPSSPATGDYWFDLDNETWKTFDSSAWVSATAVLVGTCFQDGTSTLGARSVEFFKTYEAQNSISLVKESVTEIRSSLPEADVSVWGTRYRFQSDYPRWTTSDFASGVTEAASTMYYLYLTEDGDTVVDTRPPHDRSVDLKGLYHPFESWRCIGQVFNSSGSDFVNPTGYNNIDRTNYSFASSVGSSALTVALKDVNGADFSPITAASVWVRSATITDSKPVELRLDRSLSVVVPSTATMGHVDAQDCFLYPFVLNNAGIPELGLSTIRHDESIVQTTLAFAVTSDDAKLYSTTVRSNIGIKYLGRLLSNQTTAGTWAAVPTKETSLVPFSRKAHASYNSNSGQNLTFSGVIIKYEDIVYDRAGKCYDVSTGIGTIPVAGKWRIRAMATTNASGTTSYVLAIRKNSTIVSQCSTYANGATKTSFLVDDVLEYAAGDTFDIWLTGTGTVASDATAIYNTLYFEYLGSDA